MQRRKHFIATAGCSQSIRWLEWFRDGIPSVDYYHGCVLQLMIGIKRLELVLTSIDLVPPREVAIYRSYENVVNCVGRSVGAPIGGFLLDMIGWRW